MAGRRTSGLAQPQAWRSSSPEWLTSYAAWGQGLFFPLQASVPLCVRPWKGRTGKVYTPKALAF